MRFTLKQIADIVQGELSKDSNAELIVDSVSIDSRQLLKNALFVAIRGNHQDGHNFVVEGFNQGISAALVEKTCHLHLPNLIRVENTILALGKLAHEYKKLFNIPFIAITGSNGKTTVKEMFLSICNKNFGKQHVLATHGNLNNHLGVPLTLLNLNDSHKIAIIEMGMNHANEIDYLSKIVQPSVAIINNVSFAHIGFFDNLEGVAKAKGEIFNGLIDDGVACINADSKFVNLWLKQLAKRKLKLFLFGNQNSQCYFIGVSDSAKQLFYTEKGTIEVKLNVIGKHNIDNAVAAISLAINANCSIESIVSGLQAFKGTNGRLQQKIAFNNAILIDDSYNANPESVKAAITAIKEFPKPHWLILGDLKELGTFSEALHEDVGKFAKENDIDCLLTLGTEVLKSGKNFKNNNNNWIHFANIDEIVAYCKNLLPKNATLLIKGSNSMKLWLIAHALEKFNKE